MSASAVRSMINSLYEVISIDKTEAPEGMEGKNWHRYVIERGTSVVTGIKPGTQKQVTEHVQNMVAELNARIGLKGKTTYASVSNRR